jgi:hypothetical protein
MIREQHGAAHARQLAAVRVCDNIKAELNRPGALPCFHTWHTAWSERYQRVRPELRQTLNAYWNCVRGRPYSITPTNP